MKTIDPYDVAELVNANYNGSFVDLWDDHEFVARTVFRARHLRSYLPFILEKKGEEMLEAAASKGQHRPALFMYYASDLAHNPYVAPNYYINRCSYLIWRTPTTMVATNLAKVGQM